MKIQVRVKNSYGNELIYPLCDKGKTLCELAGTKTFTGHALRLCRKLGYDFEVVIDKLEGL